METKEITMEAKVEIVDLEETINMLEVAVESLAASINNKRDNKMHHLW